MIKNGNERQTTLAKLLATENIRVQFGNYHTASFDTKNRILSLPTWKDKGKDVMDMLTGHEVGHALWTPKLNCNKEDLGGVIGGYANIVEDIRIERKIQDRYPGLVAPFRRAYDILWNESFFGPSSKRPNELQLPDRINMHAKLGARAGIQFSKEEQPIVDLCFSVETFDDTLRAARALQDFMKEQIRKQREEARKAEQAKKDAEKKAEDAENSKNSESPEKDEDSAESDSDRETDASEKSEEKTPEKAEDESQGAGEDDSDEEDSQSGSETDEDEGTKGAKSQSEENDGEEGDAEPATNSQGSSKGEGEDTDDDQDGSRRNTDDADNSSAGSSGSDASEKMETEDEIEAPEAQTVTAFEKNAAHLLDGTPETLATQNLQQPTAFDIKRTIFTYPELFRGRESLYNYSQAVEKYEMHFNRYVQAAKPYVATLTKEFEMRKAAFQYSRATTARTGTLDMNRLHSYKISDDIFLSVSQLANAKNHGLMMFVDYSGSMQKTLPYVLKHVINMALFCKSVGIPFVVYGFTDGANPHVRNYDLEQGLDGRIRLENVVILELLTSKMNKGDFRRGLLDLFIQTKTSSTARASVERLGGTPLYETMVIAHSLVKNFQEMTHVEKMTVMILSDGDGSNIGFDMNSRVAGCSGVASGSPRSVRFNLNGRSFTVENDRMMVGQALMENLSKTTGANTIGFFLMGGEGALYAAPRAASALRYNSIETMSNVVAEKYFHEKLAKKFAADKSIVIRGGNGYNHYFVLAGGKMKFTESDELDTAAVAVDSLAASFTEFSKNKQSNKVFLTEFAKSIA